MLSIFPLLTICQHSVQPCLAFPMQPTIFVTFFFIDDFANISVQLFSPLSRSKHWQYQFSLAHQLRFNCMLFSLRWRNTVTVLR